MPKLILKEAEHKLLLINAVGRCAGGCASGCGGSGLANLVSGNVYETPDPENISKELEIDIHGTYSITLKNDEDYGGPLPTEEATKKGLAAFRKHLNRCPIYRTFGGADLLLQEEVRGSEKYYYCPHYRQHEKLKEKIMESELELSG